MEAVRMDIGVAGRDLAAIEADEASQMTFTNASATDDKDQGRGGWMHQGGAYGSVRGIHYGLRDGNPSVGIEGVELATSL